MHTVWRKILTGENIDEFPTIRQYFPYQNFTFSHLPICGDPARNKIILVRRL